jgi:hypothetical protein
LRDHSPVVDDDAFSYATIEFYRTATEDQLTSALAAMDSIPPHRLFRVLTTPHAAQAYGTKYLVEIGLSQLATQALGTTCIIATSG